MLPEEQSTPEPNHEPVLESTAEVFDDLPQAAPRRRSMRWMVLGAIVVLGLLAAAFVGGRWMNRSGGQAGFDGGGPGGRMVMRASGAGGAGKQIEVVPPKELPQYEPTAHGVFVERKDNSLFIGTGNVTIGVSSEAGVKSSYTGPKVEVVITEQTKVYRDGSQPDFEATDGKYQQVAVPSSIEEISSSASITVWGRKVGDRVIADVVFFMSPVMIKKAGGPGGK